MDSSGFVWIHLASVLDPSRGDSSGIPFGRTALVHVEPSDPSADEVALGALCLDLGLSESHHLVAAGDRVVAATEASPLVGFPRQGDT